MEYNNSKIAGWSLYGRTFCTSVYSPCAKYLHLHTNPLKPPRLRLCLLLGTHNCLIHSKLTLQSRKRELVMLQQHLNNNRFSATKQQQLFDQNSRLKKVLVPAFILMIFKQQSYNSSEPNRTAKVFAERVTDRFRSFSYAIKMSANNNKTKNYSSN